MITFNLDDIPEKAVIKTDELFEFLSSTFQMNTKNSRTDPKDRIRKLIKETCPHTKQGVVTGLTKSDFTNLIKHPLLLDLVTQYMNVEHVLMEPTDDKQLNTDKAKEKRNERRLQFFYLTRNFASQRRKIDLAFYKIATFQMIAYLKTINATNADFEESPELLYRDIAENYRADLERLHMAVISNEQIRNYATSSMQPSWNKMNEKFTKTMDQWEKLDDTMHHSGQSTEQYLASLDDDRFEQLGELLAALDDPCIEQDKLSDVMTKLNELLK